MFIFALQLINMLNQFISLKVETIVKETTDAIAIYFRDENAQIPSFWPGQFLTLVLDIDGKSVRRSYSICTSPTALPLIGVCVKRVKDGLVSNYLLDNLKEGDVIQVIEPYGNFTLNHQRSELPTLALIGAGSGITPLMSILKATLEKPGQNRVHLYYGNRNQQQIIFKEQLDRLQEKHGDRLRITHLLSQPESGWQGISSRIQASLMMQCCDEAGLFADKSTNYYVCGPEAMMHEVYHMLESNGVEKERLHKESFYHAKTTETVQPIATDETDDGSRKVQIKLSGKMHEITVEPGRYILETALESGLDLPYACTMGVCGMCRAYKVQGEMIIEEQEAISESEIKDGACLTCLGRPVSHDVIIDYDRF